MISNPNTRYDSLDLAKWICALLVIVIHTAPLSNISSIGSFYFTNVLARIAVPLFFAISGFLFVRKLHCENGRVKRCAENRARLWTYWKRLALIYLLWSAVYFLWRLPEWYKSGWWGMDLLKDYAVAMLFNGSHYHLWYILASLYAVPILYFLMQNLSRKKLLVLSIALYCIECMIYSYGWLLPDVPAILSWTLNRFSILFDAVFRAVPLLAIGSLSAVTVFKPRRWGLLTTAFFLALVTEASALYFFSPNNDKFSYLIFTPVFAFFALQMLLNADFNLRLETAQFFRRSSLVIYCIHPLFIEMLTRLGLDIPLFVWPLVTMLSHLASIAYTQIRIKLKSCR